MQEIVIMISTYNGEKFIKEQLDSIINQTYQSFRILVRDDISSDNTKKILNQYNVELISSKSNLGPKESFSVLLEYAIKNTSCQYFMFCDQDDIWESDKVERTLYEMEKIKNNSIPILIHSNLEVVDEKLVTISDSMWQYEGINPSKNTLNRLLMQNTITGCTMMINRKLAILSLPVANKSIMHDWWIALVASYFGKIVYINETTIKYRQHSNNTIGAKKTSNINIIKYIIGLCLGLIKGDRNYLNHMKVNFLQAKAFLEVYEKDLDSKTIGMLHDFIKIKDYNFLEKRRIIYKYKLYKQNKINNLSLFFKI